MMDDSLLFPCAAVYGVVMNDRRSLDKLGQAALQPPYKGLPSAPVMYLKPRNTWAASGVTVCLPRGEGVAEVAAVLGLRMGHDVARLSEATALEHVDACVLAADLSLPHDDYYRPAIRQKCFDGSLPLLFLPDVSAVEAAALVLRTRIDGRLVDEFPLSSLLRLPADLLATVTEFMTLRKGDVLLTGVTYAAPQASVGSMVEIEAAGADTLRFTLAQEGGRP